MKMRLVGLGVVGMVFGALAGFALPRFENADFESDFGSADSGSVWGEFGRPWGGAALVTVAGGAALEHAHSGVRALKVDVPPGSWNGIWQQVPWGAQQPFTVAGWYLIKGGDLPGNCAAFLKVEFMDGQDNRLGEKSGERLARDTGGQWVKSALSGVTPPGTEALRFVIVVGDNAGGQPIVDRIFWDDVGPVANDP